MNTRRLLDGDIYELRDRYLADLAHLCHVIPNAVDALRLRDFAHLVLWIDEYHKANKPSQ